MQSLSCLGDNTKYLIELYHQDGALQDKCRKCLSDYKQNHESQHKAEHRSSHPKVKNVKRNHLNAFKIQHIVKSIKLPQNPKRKPHNTLNIINK